MCRHTQNVIQFHEFRQILDLKDISDTILGPVFSRKSGFGEQKK